MRIALFSDCFLPKLDGVVISVVNSARWLGARGHSVLILTARTDRSSQVYLGRNVRVEYCAPLRLKIIRYPEFELGMPSRRVMGLLRAFRPDVIHSHMPSLLGWQAALYSKLFRVPLVASYQTLLPEFLEHMTLGKALLGNRLANKAIWAYTRRYYNSSTVVLVPSKVTKDILLRHNVRAPVKVISLGVDVRLFYPRKSRKKGRTILHVGRLSSEKRVEVVIRAVKRLLENGEKVALLIGGDGPAAPMLKQEAGKHLGRGIFFLGRVEHRNLPALYSGADLFVTASPIETEGLVILEAMACGLPVVGVDAMAVPEIVRHGVNGFLANPGDDDGISGFIDILLGNARLRERFGRESLKVARRHSLERTGRALEKVYASVVKRGASSSPKMRQPLQKT